MTVNTENITSGPYTGNDVADEFSYGFRIEESSQIEVYQTIDDGEETILVLDTDYTVDSVGDDVGGTITRVDGALPTGYTWWFRANYSQTQETAFESQGSFFPSVHEKAIDKLTFLIQQLQEEVDRAAKVGVTSGITADELIESLFEAEETATEQAAIATAATVVDYITARSRNNPGTWVINDLIPYKPVYIGCRVEYATGDALMTFSVTSGSDMGGTNVDTHLWAIGVNSDPTLSTVPSMVIIPTLSTLTIEIHAMGDMTCFLYQ